MMKIFRKVVAVVMSVVVMLTSSTAFSGITVADEVTVTDMEVNSANTLISTENETTTAAEITMDMVFDEDTEWAELGGYTIYVGKSWNGSTAVAGVDENNTDHVKIQQTASNWSEAWACSLKRALPDLQPEKHIL